jgi:hypothetical protein
LAAQPTGYFILNDVMRIISEKRKSVNKNVIKSEVRGFVPNAAKDVAPKHEKFDYKDTHYFNNSVPTSSSTTTWSVDAPAKAPAAVNPQPPVNSRLPANTRTSEPIKSDVKAADGKVAEANLRNLKDLSLKDDNKEEGKKASKYSVKEHIPKEEPKSVVEEKKAPSSWASLAKSQSDKWKSGVVTESKTPIVTVVAETPRPENKRFEDRNQRDNRDDRDGRNSHENQDRDPQRRRPSINYKSNAARNEVSAGDLKRSSNESNNSSIATGDEKRKSPKGHDFDENKSIFVGNLHKSVKKPELKAAFEVYGVITYIELVAVKKFAFVEFKEEAHRQAAIDAVEKPKFGDQIVSVKPRNSKL